MVRVLNERNVDFVLHAGDYVAPFSVLLLKDLNCDWLGVLGNNDWEVSGLGAVSEDRIKKGPYFLELCSKKIVLMHEFSDFDCDILVFGHTHKPKIEQAGKLLINPGEVCGWLSNKSSLAVLDLESQDAEIVYF